MNRYEMTFTAGPQHIDELGHVNNAVWVDWIQQIATAHWAAVAAPDRSPVGCQVTMRGADLRPIVTPADRKSVV